MTESQYTQIKAAASRLLSAATVLRSEIERDDEEAVFSMMDNIDHEYKALTDLVESL